MSRYGAEMTPACGRIRRTRAQVDPAISWTEAGAAGARADEARPPAPSRTWASSCPSWPRCSCAATRSRASSCGIRSRARGRRSSRRTRSAPRAAGCDLSAFNCLLTRVKTAAYDPVGAARRSAWSSRTNWTGSTPEPGDSGYLERWFAPQALAELLAFRARSTAPSYPELWRVVLSRAARSARLTRHDDLDFPREPVRGEYFCHKHRRVCRPVEEARKFLRRYARDSAQRVQEFGDVRTGNAVDRPPGRRARGRSARAGRPRLHLAALPGPHRLPRAARLRVRAARPRAARPGGDRARHDGLLRRHRRRAAPGQARAAAGRPRRRSS